MSIGRHPALWQRAHALPVPGHPVARQGVHPVPAREEPHLCDGFLRLPGRGATCREDRVAPGEAHVAGPQVHQGWEVVSLFSESG